MSVPVCYWLTEVFSGVFIFCKRLDAYEAEEHAEELHDVRVGHRVEAAPQRVAHGDHRRDDYRQVRVEAQNHRQRRACNQSHCSIIGSN